MKPLTLAASASEKYGFSLEDIYEIIRDGTGNSYQWEHFAKDILSGRDAGHDLTQWQKDSTLALQMAQEFGTSLPVHHTLLGQVVLWLSMGLGKRDAADVAKYLLKQE